MTTAEAFAWLESCPAGATYKLTRANGFVRSSISRPPEDVAHEHDGAGSCQGSVGVVHLLRKHPAKNYTAACTRCPEARTGDWVTAMNWAGKHDTGHRR